MTLFWSLTAVMVAFALVLVIMPVLRRDRGRVAGRSELNVIIHRERFAELEEDRAEGAITEAQYVQARSEMERDLLVDTSGGETGDGGQSQGRWVAAVVALVVPVIFVAFYFNLGSRDLVDGLPMAKQQEQGLSVEEMVSRLEGRLAKQPENGEGWQMLGRSYLVMKRFSESVRAFERAHELLGDDADLLADYAEAISLADGGRMLGRPAALVNQVLALDSRHPKGLWLAGVTAYQSGKAQSAVETWRQLLTLLPAEGESTQMVKAAIARVTGEAGSASTAEADAPRVVVRVDIDGKLQAGLPKDALVFVFARALQGPPAPLAVARLRIADLPATVTLDDSKAMAATHTISAQNEVIVGARVSRSGNPVAASGDLQSAFYKVAVKPNSVPLVLLIDRQIP